MLSTPNNLDLPAHDSSVDANAASFSSAQSIISQNPLSSLSPDSGKLNDTQMSVLLTALAFPISLGGRYSWMGPWGPLLRYGTYGRLPENQVLPNRTRISRTFVKKLIARARAFEKKSVDQSGLDCDTQYSEVTRSGSSIADDNDDNNFSLSEWLPPPPPPLILMRKQSMICSLQLAVRDRFHDLLIREADKQRSLNINYVEELAMFIEKTVRINAVYLFTQLHRLPKEEQAYYLDGLALKVCEACGFYLIISSLP
ncbi:unnamed protein product [Protopolystoma xenopodis]|uniref:Uncharacterized protein n=1 Tax=Protopolystoma xenopodis TaxID=117903 RepID=A0A3S5FER5_9PLAT|nr:unnamed protein product [Protopolystoma xenopodis]